jgi:uncharacterized protein YcfJ
MTMNMNNLSRKLSLACAVLLAVNTGASFAGSRTEQPFFDRGQVVSSQPIYEEVNDPRRECWTERVGTTREVVRDRSYGGAVLGGLVGGIIGNQLGKGSGRKAATVVGATTGAIVGNNIDNDGERYIERAPEREVERCRSVDNWTRKINGYNVVYRYHGHEYTTHLPYDPGPEIKLRVNVSVAETW